MELLHAEDLAPGQRHDLGTTSVTEAEIVEFALRFDPLPIHTDAAAAAAGPFGRIIGSAAHSLALYSGLASRAFMPRLALVAGKGIERMRLPHPLLPDVTHTGTIEVVAVEPRFCGEESSTLRADLHCRGSLSDQHGRVVLALDALQIVRYRSPVTR